MLELTDEITTLDILNSIESPMDMSTRDRLLGILLLLVVVTTAVFWQVRSHDFVSLDDKILVFDNKYYLRDNNSHLSEVWSKPHEQLYMPLTYSVWAILAEMARVTPGDATFKAPSEIAPWFDPNIFHSFNLLLHVFSVLLVFAILRLLICRDIPAAMGALLFCLHPVQVESVAWISELKGVMGGFFGLLAIWLYLCHVRKTLDIEAAPEPDQVVRQEKNEAQGKTTLGEDPYSFITQPTLLYILATLAFAAALLSKPATVTYPLVAGLLDYFFLRRSVAASVKSLALWFLIALPIMWQARQAQYVVDNVPPVIVRPLVALDAIAFYIGKLIWPFRLSSEYTRTPEFVIKTGLAYWTWILPAFVGVLLWWFRRYKPLLAAASVFVVVLLPVLGFIPFGFQGYSTVADRYLYVALLAPALLVAWVLARRPGKVAYAVSGTLLLLLAVISIKQTAVWHDGNALYRHTLAVNPHAWFARNNLALMARRGENYAEAERLYKEAIELRPDLMETYVNLGTLYINQKRVNEAIAIWVKAAEKSSPLAANYRNLGQAYIEIKKYDYALLAYRRAAYLEPDDASYQFKLAELNLRLKKPEEAKKHLENARRLSFNAQSFHATAASMYSKLGWLSEARDNYIAAIKLRPDDPQLHNDLGATLFRAGNPKLARSAFEVALQLDPNYPEAYHNLGRALTIEGSLAPAEKAIRRAIELNPEYSQAYVSLAEVLIKQKKTQQARAALQQALKTEPENEQARNLMRKLQ